MKGDPMSQKGTVGAVALDEHGNVVAATSTGGMVNKRIGRAGDLALIGSGTYVTIICAQCQQQVMESCSSDIMLHLCSAQDSLHTALTS